MNFTCQHCGEPFLPKDIDAALKNKSRSIRCTSCNNMSPFSQERSKHLDYGFRELDQAVDFSRAQQEFAYIVNERYVKEEQQAYHDLALACLGYALALFKVEVVFDDSDENRMEMPKLTCRYHNDRHISEDDNFKSARGYLYQLNSKLADVELQRFAKIAETVDKITDAYDEIAKSKPKDFRYGAFITYEDEVSYSVANEGYYCAEKVKRELSGKVENIFLPFIEDYPDKFEYEAAILYALDHSECMLVITDNNPDTRLTRLYQRFFYIKGERDSQLGFIRYCDAIQLTLPNNRNAQNVFEIYDTKEFTKFVCGCNKIVLVEKELPKDPSPKKPSPPRPPETESDGHMTINFLPDGKFEFGSYPQKRETGKAVNQFFNSLKVPSRRSDNGWTPMFTDRNGHAYTWYRDEMFRGQKYRGVYFCNYREPFSVRESDNAKDIQMKNGYPSQQIYVFAFAPIVWQKIVEKTGYSVCATIQAIESREFDMLKGVGIWEDSSIRSWLNGNFLETAFTSAERKNLYEQSGSHDRVLLLSYGAESGAYCNLNGKSVRGSDYMQCIGGKCVNRAIESFWVNAPSEDDRANVVFPASAASGRKKFADMTSVAVIPKIFLNPEEIRYGECEEE